MNDWRIQEKFFCIAGRIAGACGTALPCLFVLAGTASGQSPDTEWKADTRFYVSGLSYYWAKDDASALYDTLAATGELRFRSDARPWYVSLFADYRYSTDRKYSDQQDIGAYLKYGRYRWDATAFAFVNKSPRSHDSWLYAGRLRYRLAEDHKVGIEAIGTFRNPQCPQLMLGYYGTISEALSITLAAGRGTRDGPDLSARLELTWRVF